MNINFDNLEKIEDVLKILQTLQLNQINHNEKRWLSTKELSQYIPFSVETINKKVQSGYFIEGVHFYQKGKIRFFDKQKIDEWILSSEKTNVNNPNFTKKQEILNKISLSLAS